MKRVYLVRHGESEMNARGKVQGPGGGLSKTGRQQASFLADRFRTIPVDLIVSSPYERTQETAEVINTRLHKEIVYSDLFAERRDPSRLVGLDRGGAEYREAFSKIVSEREINPAFKFSDEETFPELKERVIGALGYLERLPQSNLLVVSHAGLLRMLVGIVILGAEIDFSEYQKIFWHFRSRHTGVSLVELREKSTLAPAGWRLVSWNDQAHLGSDD